MRTTVALLILFTISSFNAFAQDYTRWGLPDGAKARFGKGSIDEIQYSPDGTRLAVASSIGIWLYDTTTYDEIALLTGHAGSVNSVAFSPDGRTIASGDDDRIVRLWDAVTGEHIRTLEGHRSWVGSVSFSPDGNTLASGDGVDIRVWDAATGEHIRTIEGHTDWVSSVAFSPDGRTLASGSNDGSIHLWDAATGRHIRTLEGHAGSVDSVVYSPDGRTLASGSWDATIRLWDAVNGEHIRTLEGHTGQVLSVSFSPDGRTLASGSGDSTVLLWDIAPSLSIPASDVNGDGVVNVIDLALVALQFGQTGQTDADVNGDGVVHIDDLIQVASSIGSTGQAPQAQPLALTTITPADVQSWIAQAEALNRTDAMTRRGIRFLEQLLSALTPKETALLPNYPNPFNPETWIPYHLARDADVQLTIYDIQGEIVRRFDLEHQSAGFYTDRSKAAYWDGRNESREPVASGVYFYYFSTGDYSQMRRLVILK